MPDPTLTLNLGGVVTESKRMASSITPKSGPWDVIVVGSGAAGGMKWPFSSRRPGSRC